MRHPMLEGLEVRITPSTDVWTGAAALASQDYNWSNATNWSQGAPQSGENLQFPAASANNYIPTQPIDNDLSGETFGSIEIDSAGYTIAGNPISLTASTGIFTTYTSGVSAINLNATLSGTDITIAAGGELDLNGDISDTNGLITSGGGILGGTGQLPALAVQSNQVSPGTQGVGTLTVQGAITFAQTRRTPPLLPACNKATYSCRLTTRIPASASTRRPCRSRWHRGSPRHQELASPSSRGMSSAHLAAFPKGRASPSMVQPSPLATSAEWS